MLKSAHLFVLFFHGVDAKLIPNTYINTRYFVSLLYLKININFKSSFVHYQVCNHTTKFVNTKSSSRDENIYSSFP